MADDGSITENRLRKRRLEREIEETEDFFRNCEQQDGLRRQADAQLRAEQDAALRRARWTDGWLALAFQSKPAEAPNEIELEIHRAVLEVLERLQPTPPEDWSGVWSRLPCRRPSRPGTGNWRLPRP